jgi:hypothetical protein
MKKRFCADSVNLPFVEKIAAGLRKSTNELENGSVKP